jgi:hypothetical protein
MESSGSLALWKTQYSNQEIWDLAWWCTPVIPTLEKLRQANGELEASLGLHIKTLFQNKNKTTKEIFSSTLQGQKGRCFFYPTPHPLLSQVKRCGNRAQIGGSSPRGDWLLSPQQIAHCTLTSI